VVSVKSLVGALLLLAGLTACSDRAPAPKSAQATAADAGYLAPPAPDLVQVTGTGLRLSGSAPPGGKVRLATPEGQALFAEVGQDGRWTIPLPPLAHAQIFGLSVSVKGRVAQAEGYVVVTPQGQAGLLRAGAGARRIDKAGKLGIHAIDFDRGGGVEVSAKAPARTAVMLRLDGRLAAQGEADGSGRYSASLPTQGSSTEIRPGAHQLQVSGEGFSDSVVFEVSPPAPLEQQPARSQLTSAGLRVDWMTPGGGVQSTILVH
jgi:hypothetical protein